MIRVILSAVTVNFTIMSIVGSLNGFNVVTLVFLVFAFHSVCLWFKQIHSRQMFQQFESK